MEINTLLQTGYQAAIGNVSRAVSRSADALSNTEIPAQFRQTDNSGLADRDSLALSTSAVEKNMKEQEAADSDKPVTRDQTQPRSPTGEPLSEQELQEIEDLKRRDFEVRAHEQAHLSAAGNLAQGGANFDYETGPDGKRYAVGGEVSIDTSKVAGDPQATLIKAQKIRRAASAPVDPSAQDRSVAAEASRMEAQARVEISQQGREKQNQYIEEHTPKVDFFSESVSQNQHAIDDTYKRIQNTQVLEQQRIVVDVFI